MDLYPCMVKTKGDKLNRQISLLLQSHFNNYLCFLYFLIKLLWIWNTLNIDYRHWINLREEFVQGFEEMMAITKSTHEI